MLILPHLQINAVPNKIPRAFFMEERKKKTPKIYIEHVRSQIAKANLRKKNEAGGIIISDYRLSCKATVLKPEWFGH